MIPLLMTRPRDRADAFVAGLPAGLVTPHYAPMWRMERVDSLMPEFDVAVMTSANGVRFGPEGAGRAAFCVGTATTELAARHGWAAQCAGRTAEELVARLTEMRPDGVLVHFSGERTRGDVAARLDALHRVVYRQVPLPLAKDARRLLEAGPVIVPLFSPDGAQHFAQEARSAPTAHLVAISAATARAAGMLPCAQIVTAPTPDADAMREAVQKLALSMLSG